MDMYEISIRLKSDATFGRGDGIPGSVDREVEHDELGLPYVRGRTLKGLLSEEVDNILFSISSIEGTKNPNLDWQQARVNLFGRAGSRSLDAGKIHFGPASFHENIRLTIMEAIQNKRLSKEAVLDSLTTVRRQTAIETSGESYGVPVEHSLRSMRVVLRETELISKLKVTSALSVHDESLLAVGIMAFRRAGTGRNRGRGAMIADLRKNGESILHEQFQKFVELAEL